MTPDFFNLALHEHLTALGYIHTRREAEFDDGDPENGPGTWSCPAYDEYEGPDEYVFATEIGGLDREARDTQFEQWLASHGDEAQDLYNLTLSASEYNTVRRALCAEIDRRRAADRDDPEITLLAAVDNRLIDME
jgi:hypothetical protein